MLESTVKTHIKEYLEGLDECYYVKFGGGASAAKGTPDLLVCYKGWFVGIELKKPEDSYGTTQTQLMRMKQIRDAGGIAFVAASIKDVATALSQLEGR